MRIAIWTVVSLVAVIGVVALIGYFLPVDHEASRSIEINKRPEAVFALLSDLDNYQTWWPGATVKSEIVETAPPNRIVTRVVGETQFGGTWTIQIDPTSTGSRVTITERGEVYNLIFRTLVKFMFGYTGTMEACLAAARKKLAT